jgi:Tfp pilus assembly PilM family ATPase
MGAWADRLRFGGSGRTFVAVDFDSRQLRVVLAEKAAGRTRVLKLAAVAMPEGIDVEAGNGKLADLLGRTLKDLGAAGAGVLMHLSRSQAVLKPITLPPGTPVEQMPAMVAFQAEKELPFHPEEAVVDFCIEEHHYDAAAGPEAPAGVDVLVGATRLPVVSRYRELATGAGARLLRLGLRPYANLRCVEACTVRGARENVLLVHLTGEEAEIDVIVGDSLAFSRAVTMKMPGATASAADKETAVGSLAMEVARNVQSYQAVQRGEKVDAALVAGGTGLEAALAEQVAKRLGVRCEMLDPSGALRLGEVANASAFISTLGLAIAHTAADPPPFDFLNPKRPSVRKNVRKATVIALGSALGVALVALAVAGAMDVSRVSGSLDDINAEYGKAMDVSKKLKKEIERVKRLEAWEADGRDWLSHWAMVSAMLPSCTDAYVQSFKTLSDGAVSFTINARESRIITDLGVRLTEAGYKFQPGRLATVNDPYGYTYAADIRVTPGPDMKLDLASVRPPPRPFDDDSLNQWMKGGPGAAGGVAPGSGAAGSGAAGSGAVAPAAGSGAGAVAASGAPAPQPGTDAPPWRKGGYDPRSYTGRGEGSAAHTPPPAAGAAAPAVPPDPAAVAQLTRELLEACDRDQDGKLSGAEYKSAYPLFYSKGMKVFDVNQNGHLDSEERRLFEAWRHALPRAEEPGR